MTEERKAEKAEKDRTVKNRMERRMPEERRKENGEREMVIRYKEFY